MRLINAVRDLNAETGAQVQTVALHTDVDAGATFVREADLAYDLGPAAARPYINLEVLERALVESGADAAWVGWGFVAEDPAFAELCDRIGVTFIGPSADAMRQLGDKIGAKLIAEEVGVPVAPWSGGEVSTQDEAVAAAEKIGYPLMLKATAGGGGRGIRRVDDQADLVDAYQRTRDEAERAFGSGIVFLERLVTGARHVEVQVISDGETAWALGVRDCSVQRRNQKVIEESASPVLGPEQVDEVKAAAERLAVRVGYRGAATVEFLYHPGEKLFAFLEVNTRLQVEHPITEVTNDFDLVRAQIHVAEGGKLTGERPTERGHAVEARLNAEDPDRDFAPSPGYIARLELPSGPGVRVDTGVSEGDTIPADFDSMIAKIIAYGSTREQALGRLRRAMSRTRVVIEGGATNSSFIIDLLDQPEVIDGSADTGWIDRVRDEGRLVSHRHSSIALAAAAIDAYEEEEQAERNRLFATARGGRPQVMHESGNPVDFKLRGASYRVRVARIDAHRFRVVIDAGEQSQTADVVLERFDEHTGRITVNGERHRVLTDTHGPVHLVDVDGVTHRVSRDEGGVVRSPAPALVIATPLEVGAEVAAGDPVLVLESMKMETVLRAPFSARLKECLVTVGAQVETGAALLRLEPLGDDDAVEDTAAGAVLDLPAAPADVTPGERGAQQRDELRSLMLGFDVDPGESGTLLDDYLEVRQAEIEADERPLAAETELAGVFADLAELARRRPAEDEINDRIHSAREHFHTYLQSLDVELGGQPAQFRSKLSAALAHYGVDDLERTDELESAVFRIFLALQRMDDTVPGMSRLLRRWMKEPPPAPELREHVGHVLEHLAAATQVRFPAIADLARGVLYTWYGRPRLRRTRERVYAAIDSDLTYLDAHPDASDRGERIAEMVKSTEPLVRVLSRRLADDSLDNAVMLEVLTRRYYGNKGLSGVAAHRAGGVTFVMAQRGASILVSAATGFAGLDTAMCGLAELSDGAASIDADVYVRWDDQPDDLDEMAAKLHEVVSARALPHQVHRVTVTVAGPGDEAMHHHVTFRPSATGMTEDRLIRGLHPYIAQRMQMERLRKFDVTRLRSSDDEEVYLYRAVAKANPNDDRLIAFAQLRDLTAVSEPDGSLLTLPTAERTFEACVDSIRRAQAKRPSSKRFNTNRIIMYVWPPLDVTETQLTKAVRHTLLASDVDGAGLEEILLIGRHRDQETGELHKVTVEVVFDAAGQTQITVGEPDNTPIEPVDEYRQKVLRAARRNTVYPYELTDILGDFTEYDLTDDGTLAPVTRPKGGNTAALIVGTVTTPTPKFPEGITRVVALSDPTKSLGALKEAECARLIGALNLAEELQVPLEWYALSSGAAVEMDSGTENLDWVAAALRRIIEFTQDGGEINIVVTGINVGGQAYWNAEATMMMHTKGILVMTPDSSMVLTGKNALDFSGGVSAEDNFGIGGYDRVMGPNGEAQYWAPNLTAAIGVLMSHYVHSYVAPGEDGPRPAVTADPIDRDISDYPHEMEGSEFATVGDVFSTEANPDRKKPFDIRAVMRAVTDQDQPMLERWAGMADAETVVATDTHIGGLPVTLIGIESKPVPRRGFVPTDGPDSFSAGTLFPQSSKKAARAINAASGNRPVVVLANLSGFDGSPESMRKLQLEYGAEIGRAIVNFDGPIVFCVISRYHGGAFVVFSKALNPNMTVLAIEGSFASVLGGAPAAAVVFAGEVRTRTENDPRLHEVQNRLESASDTEHASLSAELVELRATVRAEKLAEVAAEFDGVHSIERAVRVGSADAIIAAAELRPAIIKAIVGAGS